MPSKNTLHLTRAAIKALPIPPAGKRGEYRDDEVPSLALRITPTGHISFCVIGWHKESGELIRDTFGTFPAMLPEQARREALKRLGKLAEGIDPRERRRKARDDITLGELLDRYIEDLQRRGKRTFEETRRTFARYVGTSLLRRKAGQITRRDMADLHGGVTRGGAPVAANRLMAHICAAFNYAITAGLATENPASGVGRNEEIARDRFIEGREMSAFFRALEAEPNGTMRDFFIMCLLTTQRKSDVLAMRWSQLDLANAVWHLPRVKHGDPHTAVLAEDAVALLRERHAARESDFVFPGSGSSGHLVEVKSAWKRLTLRMVGFMAFDALVAANAVPGEQVAHWTERLITDPAKSVAALESTARAAGVCIPPMRDLRVHDLRRTAGSYMAMTNASLALIGKTLNHKSVQATKIYARFHVDAPRGALETAIDKIKQERDRSSIIAVKGGA